MGPMSNRRTSTRQKSFLQGRIYFNNRKSSIDCLIRDLTNEGAKLTFSATIAVPEAIELYIPAKDQYCRAKIHWRHGEDVGAVFVLDRVAAPSTAPSIPAADHAGRIQRLEADVAALQRLVRELRAERQLRQGVD
jgi:hypothetical protein